MTKITAAIGSILLAVTLAIAGIAMSAPASAHHRCNYTHTHYYDGKQYKVSMGRERHVGSGVYGCYGSEWVNVAKRGQKPIWKMNQRNIFLRTAVRA